MDPARRAFRPDRPAISELAAGAAVIHRESRDLLLLHQQDEDRWCFPKGHVEAGESLAEAARREVREETGITDLVLGAEIATVAYRFFDTRRRTNVFKTSVYFLGITEERSVRPERTFDDHRWCPLAAARRLVPYATDREVLDKVEGPLARLS